MTLSTFKDALENIRAYEEGPHIDLPLLRHSLERAASMKAAFIEHLGIPKVGDHVRLVKRAWPDSERRHYLAAGNTGTVVGIWWHTRSNSFRLEYKPDCEWRFNKGSYLDQEKCLYVHEAPGPTHSIHPSYFEVIETSEAEPYSCYCTSCGWHGRAVDTATGGSNYALCPECQIEETSRSKALLRFNSPEIIPGCEELDYDPSRG